MTRCMKMIRCTMDLEIAQWLCFATANQLNQDQIQDAQRYLDTINANYDWSQWHIPDENSEDLVNEPQWLECEVTGEKDYCIEVHLHLE